jgi:hypothetical protein
MTKQLHAVHPGHAQIREYERNRISSQLLERFVTVRRLDTSEAVSTHHVRQNLTQSRLVIDDETIERIHDGRGGAHGSSSAVVGTIFKATFSKRACP